MINLGKFSKNGKDIILEEMDNGCIECISHCKDSDGYARIQYRGKQNRLFRVIYEKKYGEIPKGMLIRHKCDNSSCCNIKHLEIGTSYDNVQDMIKRGRAKYGMYKVHLYGTKNPHSKLSEEQVKEIYMSNLSNKELARLYNVSDVSIRNIKNKKCWNWLTDKLYN